MLEIASVVGLLLLHSGHLLQENVPHFGFPVGIVVKTLHF